MHVKRLREALAPVRLRAHDRDGARRGLSVDGAGEGRCRPDPGPASSMSWFDPRGWSWACGDGARRPRRPAARHAARRRCPASSSAARSRWPRSRSSTGCAVIGCSTGCGAARTGPAPRDAGFWGELGYRIERALRDLGAGRAHRARPPVAVLFGDRGLAERRLAARRGGPDRVAAIRARPTTSRSIRSATGSSASPTWSARRHSSPTCRRGDLRRADDIPGAARPGARCRCWSARYGEAMKLVLSQDMTEEERTERMRRDFVANVSHEIRTPLTVLSGFLETLTQPAAERGRAQARARDDGAADAAHGHARQRSADAGAARRQPAPGRRPLGRLTASAGAGRGRCAGAVGGSSHAALRGPAGAEIAGDAARAASAHDQPRQQRRALHARRRHDRGRMARARRRRRRAGGRRHRPRHRARAPAAPDRALLSRRRQPLARDRRHRPRPVDRQARRAAPRRRTRSSRASSARARLSRCCFPAARVRTERSDGRVGRHWCGAGIGDASPDSAISRARRSGDRWQ